MKLPDEWGQRACVVREVEQPERWFSPDELAIVALFRNEKRRVEWMLSRIAEKELRQHGATGTHVSYSHSGLVGAAAVGESPVGIDVEVVRDLNARAAHLFLSDVEERTVERCRIPHALLHFWSAKEARWKQFGGSIPTLKRVPLTLVEVRPNGLVFDGVETIATDDLVVALTRPTS